MKKFIIIISIVVLSISIKAILKAETYNFDTLATAISNNDLKTLKNAKLLKDLSKIKGKLNINLLMYAAAEDNPQIAQWLIDNTKIDINEGNQYGRTALMYGASYNSLDTIKVLVKNKANLDAKDLSGANILFFAVGNNSIDVLNYLYEKGMDLNTIDNDSSSLIIRAAGANACDSIRWLIEKGANINTDEHNHNPTEFTFSYNDAYDAARLLIEEGADLSYEDNYGDNYLIMAARAGRNDLIATLLNKGIPIDRENLSGRTALMIAAENGHLASFNYLLEKGANINKINNFGQDMLHHAAQGKSKEIVDYLLKKGFNPNKKSESGTTAFMHALRVGNKQIVKLLYDYLKSKDEIIYKNGEGVTLIMYAAEGGLTDFIATLIKDGHDINEQDKEGKTALWYVKSSVSENDPKTFDFLVKNGANVNILNNEGYTFLHSLVRDYFGVLTDDISFIKHVAESGSDLKTKNLRGDSLLFTATHKTRKLVEFFINKGLNVNEKNNEGKTPFLEASRGSIESLEICKLLISKGANIKLTDNNGENALMHASTNDTTEVLEYLLEKGLDINALNKEGQNILWRPSAYIEFFITKGAKVNIKDKNGDTPLLYWVKEFMEYPYMTGTDDISILIKNGADVNIKDAKGKSAYEYAMESTGEDSDELKSLFKK